jgi:dUTP pyrophosphatase
MNLSNRFFRFEKGQKVAQLLIQKIETVELKETKTLSNTERGQKGFGSSGK